MMVCYDICVLFWTDCCIDSAYWFDGVVFVCVFVFFFFQAEDGIRDLVRSRGLGDVYKRQLDYLSMTVYYQTGTGIKSQTSTPWDIRFKENNLLISAEASILSKGFKVEVMDLQGKISVSYTHLTLPTSDLV